MTSITNFPTPEAKLICEELLPALMDRFLEKNRKYALVGKGHDLGAKGIIPDVNRKTAVLISRLWYNSPVGIGEPTDEVIDDLIGHLLLLKAKLRRRE